MNKILKPGHIVLALALVAAILLGCTEQPQQIAQPQGSEPGSMAPDDEYPLAWVQKADPKIDAQQAINSSDWRLLAFAGRAISVPGIDLAIYPLSELEQHCGYRVVKGTGDVIKSQSELPLRSKMHDYAVVYNRYIIARCYAQ